MKTLEVSDIRKELQVVYQKVAEKVESMASYLTKK